MRNFLITEEQLNFLQKYYTINEDIDEMAYPASFNMEEFKNCNSFAARVRYCQARLPRISSGSSRIVYKIDDEKVLKLAKNAKRECYTTTEYIQYYEHTNSIF